MNEQEFRALCAINTQKHPTLTALRTIALVGGYDGQYGSDEKDSARLTTILNYLAKSGVPISPDFEVDVVNFREGRDFLREDNKTDLVIVSYILEGTGSYVDMFWPDSKTDDQMRLMHMVSRRNDGHYWQRRAEKADTKMVVTYGGEYEVGTSQFCDGDKDEPLITLIPTPDAECMSSHAPPSRFKELYPSCSGLDLPCGWFGFVGNKNYLQSIRPAFNKATYLGKKCLEITKPEPTNNIGLAPQP